MGSFLPKISMDFFGNEKVAAPEILKSVYLGLQVTS